jgi:hypothetical protein
MATLTDVIHDFPQIVQAIRGVVRILNVSRNPSQLFTIILRCLDGKISLNKPTDISFQTGRKVSETVSAITKKEWYR